METINNTPAQQIELLKQQIETAYLFEESQKDTLIEGYRRVFEKYFTAALPAGTQILVDDYRIEFKHPDKKIFYREYATIYINREYGDYEKIRDLSFSCSSFRTDSKPDLDVIITVGRIAEAMKNFYDLLMTELAAIKNAYNLAVSPVRDQRYDWNRTLNNLEKNQQEAEFTAWVDSFKDGVEFIEPKELINKPEYCAASFLKITPSDTGKTYKAEWKNVSPYTGKVYDNDARWNKDFLRKVYNKLTGKY